MSNENTKMGEGGVHLHVFKNESLTDIDGLHKHLFYINDRILMTELDGQHSHQIDKQNNIVMSENENHVHKLLINTRDGVESIFTEKSVGHSHEIQSEKTTLSGLHAHVLKVNDENYLTMLPSDLIKTIENKIRGIPKFKKFKLKRNNDSPLENDFFTLQKLNKLLKYKMVKTLIVKNIIKNLTRLSDGLKIESLILSRQRFNDIGDATRFVLDNGLDIKQSNVIESEGVFTFSIMSKDRFLESTLQRVRITEGVEAVVGFLLDNEIGQQVSNGNETLEGSIDEMSDLGKSKMETLKDKAKKVFEMYDIEKKGCGKKPKGRGSEDNNTFKNYIEICKVNNEKRLVTGPALIPDVYDLQDDIISKEEVEKAAYRYMIKLSFRDDPEFLKNELGMNNKSDRGFMHVEFNRKIAIVESYIAPIEFNLNNRVITKGTWIVTMKVFDDEVWNLVKSNKIRGFSIGGQSTVIEEN